MKRVLAFLAVTCIIVACDRTPTAPARADASSFAASSNSGIPLNAEMQFGADPGAHGTNFEPGSGHDESFHSYDHVFPRTVNIQAGGSVTFEIEDVHQVAIYAPGTRPADINVSLQEPIPVLPFLTRITDPNNRIALGPDQTFGETIWTSPPHTFDTPGTYLVICTTTVHFVLAKMYAYVNVF